MTNADAKRLLKTFKVTKDMKDAARIVFKYMALVATLEPVVTAYERKVLAFWQFKINPEMAGSRAEHNEIILDPKHTYLLTDDDFKLYHADVKNAEKAAGLDTGNYETCPLLVAKAALITAEHHLINVMEPFTSIGLDQTCLSLKIRKDYIDLTLRLLAPYVK